MEGESTRQQKIGKQLQKDLAEIIRSKGMAAFDGAMVTVSEVRVSPDLSFAKVFVSIFPSAKGDQAMDLLQNSVKQIRGELGRLVGKQFSIAYTTYNAQGGGNGSIPTASIINGTAVKPTTVSPARAKAEQSAPQQQQVTAPQDVPQQQQGADIPF